MVVGRLGSVCAVWIACASCAGSPRREEPALLVSAGHPSGGVHDIARARSADSEEQPPSPAPSVTPPAPPPDLRAFTDEELMRITRVQRIVHKAAKERDLPPDLVNGIIWVESKFNPRARGHKGPRGLMQLMPRTARELARQLSRRYAPFDPDFNIHAGTYYFSRMVERYDGDLTLAVAAYNVGPGVVDVWKRDGLPLSDTIRTYVQRVFTAARAFRNRGGELVSKR